MVPQYIFNSWSSTWNPWEQGLGSQNLLECLHPHFETQSLSTENEMIEKLHEVTPPYNLEAY